MSESPADRDAAPVEREPRRTAPVGLVVAGIAGLRQSIPALLALIFVLRDTGPILWVAIGVGFLALAANIIIAGLSWHRLTFHVGADDIRVESGIVSRAARSVPYERIQDVSVEQGPLARIFGLVEVAFDTGAGGKDDLKLAYLTEEEGEELRELVRARKEGLASAVEDREDKAQNGAEPLFAMPPRRVLTFGLFEFSLAAFAVLLGATQQFDFLLDFDPWDLEGWQERLAGPGSRLAALGQAAQIVGGIIAVLSLLAVGFATGLIRTALREWDFRLDRTAKGFRRRRGLLTRTDVVMPAHRVQAMRIGTRLIRRRFGWHSLRFISLAQDSGSSSHVVAPFAKLAEIWPIADIAGFDRPGGTTDWQRSSRAYRFDTVLLTVLSFSLPAIVLFAIDRPLWAVVPLALAAIFGATGWMQWRAMWHATDAHQILSRTGWLAPKIDIAPRVKLQSVDFRQGPLGRRHGYGTLHLGVAGGSLAISGVPEERALELRRAILASMTAADFSQLNEG